MFSICIAVNRADLQTILWGLPDDMKLEVSTNLDIPATTVGALRKLETLPCTIRLQVPWVKYSESTVKIGRPG